MHMDRAQAGLSGVKPEGVPGVPALPTYRGGGADYCTKHSGVCPPSAGAVFGDIVYGWRTTRGRDLLTADRKQGFAIMR
ncbi:MAG: hypothetical protein HoeaKO_14870 [Hoeflea alexandrii]